MSEHSIPPYPDTDGIIKNTRLLCDIAGARAAEFETISNYVYYSLILADEYPMLSELFEKMSMTEMRHFQLLGRMMIKLGGDPSVRIRHSTASCGCVSHESPHQVKRILSDALEHEQAAHRNYTRICEACCADRCAAALIERLALDEEHHARMLSRALCEF